MIGAAVSTGLGLGALLIALLLFWGLLDFLAWVFGWETFSQWIIKTSERNRTLAVLFLLIILLGAGWLVVHFELPETIWNLTLGTG